MSTRRVTRRRRRSRRSRWRRNRGWWLLLAAFCLIVTAITWWAWNYVDEAFAPDVVPRVLYSETANCTPRERLLVAGVMHNRIGQPAFGRRSTLKQVVTQPAAFSCIGDSTNLNWQKTRHPDRMTAAERAVWSDCLTCITRDIPPALGPSGKPLVYYHDKSIGAPASWLRGDWRALRELSTEHFIFYSITPAHP